MGAKRVDDGVQIRRLRPEEWLHLKTLRMAALAEAPYAFGSTFMHEEAYSDAQWEEVARGVVYVAVEGDDWLGMAGVYRHPAPDVIVVWGMWVRPDRRRQGLGRGLLQAVVDWARAQEADRIQLGVSVSNEPAHRLYRSQGFISTGRTRPLRSDPSIVEILMERIL